MAILALTVAITYGQRLEPGNLSFSQSGTVNHNDWNIGFEMSGTFFPRTDTPAPDDAYLSGTAVTVDASAGIALRVGAPQGAPGYVVQKIEVKVGESGFVRLPRILGPSAGQWVLFTSTHFPSGQSVPIEARATFISPDSGDIFTKTISRSFTVHNKATTYVQRFQDLNPLAQPYISSAYAGLKNIHTAGNYEHVSSGELDKATFLSSLNQASAWGALAHGLPDSLEITFFPDGTDYILFQPELESAITSSTPKAPKLFHVIAIACKTLVGKPAPIQTASHLCEIGGFVVGFAEKISPFAYLDSNGAIVSLGVVLNDLNGFLAEGLTITASVRKVNE